MPVSRLKVEEGTSSTSASDYDAQNQSSSLHVKFPTKSSKSVACVLCERHFSSEQAYRNHVQRIHPRAAKVENHDSVSTMRQTPDRDLQAVAIAESQSSLRKRAPRTTPHKPFECFLCGDGFRVREQEFKYICYKFSACGNYKCISRSVVRRMRVHDVSIVRVRLRISTSICERTPYTSVPSVIACSSQTTLCRHTMNRCMMGMWMNRRICKIRVCSAKKF
jgi:hypothetical protein